MIFDKLSFLAKLSPNRRAAQRLAKRWSAAAVREPELAHDVIRMGGILAGRVAAYENGIELPEPVDPTRLALERGRMELAQELLALMSINPFELNQIVEQNNELD